MINKDFFSLKEDDVVFFKGCVDKYREDLLSLIDSKPSMTVSQFLKWEDDLAKDMDNVLLKYSFLFMAHQKPEVMSSYNELIKYNKDKLSDFSYNKDYFDFISSLKTEDESDVVWQEKQVKDFIKRGLNLPKKDQDRLIEISKELSELSINFLQNINLSRKEWSFELPLELISTLKEEHQNLFKEGKMSYNMNNFIDIMTTADNKEVRRKLSEKNKEVANVGTSHDNSEIIKKIVLLKHENANILGKKSVCDLILEETMSEDFKSASDFLINFKNSLLPFAIKEDQALGDFVQEKFGISEIESYSAAYYSDKYKEHLFSYKKDEERKYFNIDDALKATFNLIENLFNISFEKVKDGFIFPIENEDIPTYRIINNGKVKGQVVLDLYEREGKKTGAWVSNLIAPTANSEGLLSLTASFDKNKDGLSFSDLTTLLHEFGHLVHAVSSETKYRNNSGTNGVPRDAVEIPSQMLEKFAKDEDFLKEVSHGRIPDELIQKANAMNKFRKANFYTRQVGMSSYDLSIYNDVNEDVLLSYKKNMDNNNPVPVDADSNFPMTFAHIFSGGYSSGYYGYLWSDVYSVDAFSYIKEDPKERALSFKNEILAHGSSRPAKELYSNFKSEPASFERFLDFYDLKEQPKKRLRMR